VGSKDSEGADEIQVRIVIVGDYQLENTPQALTEYAMEDIRNIHPDSVIIMGDIGDNAHIGSPQAIYSAQKLLSLIGAPVRPLLGNHDLQREIGRNTLPHGVMEYTVRKCFGIDDSFFVYEYDDVRLFGISLDSWDMEPPFSPNECHISDKRFEWIQRKIAQRPGVPIIMLTHAPPMGCGLRTIPSMHVRATNAYMDQNTDPMRWMALTEHPEIILWISAHYHFGHDHHDSLVIRNGVAYALTGVHSNVSRDDTRHSRVLDIQDGKVTMFTLDHVARQLRTKPDLQITLQSALTKRIALHPRVAHPRTPGWINTFEPLGPGGIQILPNHQLLVSTSDHYLWQADPEWEVLLGTLHYREGPLIDYCISGDLVWRIFGNSLVAVHYLDPWRFSREAHCDHRHEFRVSLPSSANSIQPLTHGVRVWMGENSLDFTSPSSLLNAINVRHILSRPSA
jgi:hypothetical protein